MNRAFSACLSALAAFGLFMAAEAARGQGFGGARGAGAQSQRYGLGVQTTGAGQLGQSPSALAGQGGRGGFGQGGQGGFGQGGFGQGGQQGMLGQGGLLQNGQQQNRGFIGRDAEDTRAMLEGLRGGDRQNSMFNMLVESLDEMRDQNRRFEARNREPPPARVTLVPAFTPPSIVSNGAAASAVQARLNRTITLPSVPGVSSPNVSMNGRVATVTGTVATEHHRKLVEQLISMQAGVSSVDNQLVVAAQDNEAGEAATSDRSAPQ